MISRASIFSNLRAFSNIHFQGFGPVVDCPLLVWAKFQVCPPLIWVNRWIAPCRSEANQVD